MLVKVLRNVTIGNRLFIRDSNTEITDEQYQRIGSDYFAPVSAPEEHQQVTNYENRAITAKVIKPLKTYKTRKEKDK